MSFDKDCAQCLEKLRWATRALDLDISPDRLHKIAKLIVQTMTGPWRCFHSPEHVFAVGDSTDAIEMLAALFHDIVYAQVDGSIHFNLTYYMAPFIEEDRGNILIRDRDELPHDPTFELLCTIFNFSPGQTLSPFAGQNEFLSAVVAAKVLEPFAPRALLAQIGACIEATIPFRPYSETGSSPRELLYQRLQLANQLFDLNLSQQEMILTVQRAVRMSNRDVSSFAHPISAVFLNSTWDLLPETNHNLQKSGSYTVRDYRTALGKMAGFLTFLQPEVVFTQFRGEPDDATYQNLVAQARRNLRVGQIYLESKLAAIAIIEALSMRIGQDVSLAIMVGELPDSKISVGRLTDYLPHILNPRKPNDDIEQEVLQLLEVGRAEGSDYDLKNSPLAAFIISYLGFPAIRNMQQEIQAFFKGELSSEDFLDRCDRHVVEMIKLEVTKLLDNRKAALLQPKHQGCECLAFTVP